LFAGVLLEGGIVRYDTHTVTGGAGAAFLGIGGRTEYRQDTVTVYLRAVSVRTGEVLTTVTASKTIASQSLGANAFRYVGFKELLQAEVGYTTNEPDQVALQQAIEKAVYGLVLEGVELKLWEFADPDAGWPLLYEYKRERDGQVDETQVAEALRTLRAIEPLQVKTAAAGDEAEARPGARTTRRNCPAPQGVGHGCGQGAGPAREGPVFRWSRVGVAASAGIDAKGAPELQPRRAPID